MRLLIVSIVLCLPFAFGFFYEKEIPTFPLEWTSYGFTQSDWAVQNFGDFWQSGAQHWYNWKEQKMRVDYYGFCEPHFGQETPWFQPFCAFIFKPPHKVYFMNSTQCCDTNATMGIIRPDFMISNKFEFKGSAQTNGMNVDVFYQNVNGRNMEYHIQQGTNIPVRFVGGNTHLGGAYFDYVYPKIGEGTVDPKIFELPDNCNSICSNFEGPTLRHLL